jgi:hypothetical protein
MARLVELHPSGQAPELRRTPLRDQRLRERILYEIEAAFAARNAQEEEWRNGKRQYAAIPRLPYRSTPVPNSPNIEVPLGAIAVDAQYAAITDTLYTPSPVLTARAEDDQWTEHAKAAQRWSNYCIEHEFGLREATDHAFFDCCQMGTAAFYIPFVEDIYKHKVFDVRWRGPRILPIEPQNVIVPGGSRGDLQRDRWCALRFWYSPGEMRLRSRLRGWDMTRAMPQAEIDWVRRKHELYGLTYSSNNWRELYEILEIYIYDDYNGDGEDLDLMVHFDRSSHQILALDFNRYDERPIVPMRYQIRPHLFYGLGIMEMIRPFQDETSEIHNHRTLNMMIANVRLWIAQHGVFGDSKEIWGNKVIEAADPNAVKGLQLGDVYPSSMQAEAATTALAERRIGMEGSASGERPHTIGTRTPGITALTALQSENKRFTPAFDQMRLGAAEAIRQGLLRQRERLLRGDSQVERHIVDVLGREDGALVIELLQQPDYDRYVQVEFTAASASVNREADRQNAILIGNLMKGYYSEVMQMIAGVSQSPIAAELIPIAKDVYQKSTELMDRLLRTFEQMRDPRRFLLALDGQFDSMAANAQQRQGLGGLAQQMLQGGAGPAGGPPQDPAAMGVGRPAAGAVDIGGLQ